MSATTRRHAGNVHRAGFVLIRLADEKQRRKTVHWSFEGGGSACHRTKHAKRLKLTREPDEVTCVECRRFLERTT